jgi:hypothetical protein
MIKYTEYKKSIIFLENNIKSEEIIQRFRKADGKLSFFGWFFVYKDVLTDEYVLGCHKFKRHFLGEDHIISLTKEGNFNETVISFLSSSGTEEIYRTSRCIDVNEAKKMCKDGKLKKIPSKYYTLFYD